MFSECHHGPHFEDPCSIARDRKSVRMQTTHPIVNTCRLRVWPHPVQCPLCCPQVVLCSQKRSFLSSTDTGQHWCLPNRMCRFQRNNPQIATLFHLLQGQKKEKKKRKTCLSYYLSNLLQKHVRNKLKISKTNTTTLTKTWGDSDVINSNKSSVVGLCFDHQLKIKSESVNILNKISTLTLINCISTSGPVLIYLERFVPLHRLRESGPAASTAGTVEHQLLLWWPWTQVHLQRAWLTDKKTNVMFFSVLYVKTALVILV